MLSNLEFAHDEFMFAMHKRHHDLSVSLSRKFPRHFKNKTDFLVNAVANVPELRQVPIFATGELNLLWLQYQLDEIYEIRSIIAHGSVFLTKRGADRITWRFERFVRKEKMTYALESVEISNGYLASVYYTASVIRHYLARLVHCLTDISCWESEYQADKEIRQNRKSLAELVALGVIDDSNKLINLFLPPEPIE